MTGHLAKSCPTKKPNKMKLIKPQVEQKAKPQDQIKVNHEDGGDMGKMKKKTRRGGKARERAMRPRMNQYAKQVSKNKEERMKKFDHIKCHACEDMGQFTSKCPQQA
jgi:hypothetical protein